MCGDAVPKNPNKQYVPAFFELTKGDNHNLRTTMGGLTDAFLDTRFHTWVAG
jgi:hypothetical protein